MIVGQLHLVHNYDTNNQELYFIMSEQAFNSFKL